MRSRNWTFHFSLVTCLFLGCTPNGTTPGSASSSDENKAVGQLVARGRGIYVSTCTACHNSDPTKDGSLGPAIHGSSRELIEARIMRAAYPDGYAPKRPTKAMPAMPHLKNEIDALYFYLNSR